jgi:hypothetical protein
MKDTVSQPDPFHFTTQILQSKLPVLVNYQTEWRESCKAI